MMKISAALWWFEFYARLDFEIKGQMSRGWPTIQLEKVWVTIRYTCKPWKIVWLLISYLWDFWLKEARVEKFLKLLLGLCVFLGCSSSHIFLVWNFYRQKMTIFAHFFQSVTCPKKCRVGSPCVGFHFLGFSFQKLSFLNFEMNFLSISAKLGFSTSFCHFRVLCILMRSL